MADWTDSKLALWALSIIGVEIPAAFWASDHVHFSGFLILRGNHETTDGPGADSLFEREDPAARGASWGARFDPDST
ncbi:MAG: hypothetical protein ACK2T3_18230, partial [Candidatus Promineifilaceae bacterium]